VKSGDKVQFVFAGGKKRVDDLHGNLDFDFGLLGILFVEDVNDQVIVLFGDADVAIVALYGNKFAVFAGADCIDEGAEVDVIDARIVNPDLAGAEAILVDGGGELFRPVRGER